MNKRIVYFNLGQSPIYSHVNATCQGLSTVRVFNAGQILEKEFHAFQNHCISSSYLLICTMRWFAFVLDLICSLYGAIVTYSFLLLEDCMAFLPKTAFELCF